MRVTIGRQLLAIGILSSVGLSQVQATQASEVNWRERQSMANFSSRNAAAPIHYQQLYKLYPSRTIETGEVIALHSSAKPLPTRLVKSLTYDYNAEERSIEDYMSDQRVTGLLVHKSGKVEHESYYYGANKDSKLIAFSTTKSIVSLLVGIAVDEGLIKSENELITDYLPELKGSGYQGATIKHILQMTTALAFPGEDKGASGQGRDIRGATVKSLAYGSGGLRRQPQNAKVKEGVEHGEAWEYLNTNTQTLAVLVERVSGQTVSDYLEEKLWKKIGAANSAHWLVDRYDEKDAMEHGWMGINATVRDYARIGLLMLNQGQARGEQVVSRQWLKASTTPDSAAVRSLSGHTSMGYGYQWWLPHGDSGDYLSVGHAGQMIYVNPERDLVIVQTAASPIYKPLTKEESVAVFRRLSEQL